MWLRLALSQLYIVLSDLVGGTAQMEDEWWCLFVKNGDRLSCMERHQG